MAKAIHSMIRVLDEARSVNFYQEAFDLAVADRLDFDSFTPVSYTHLTLPTILLV